MGRTTFKANRGNLMQHWFTCETVRALSDTFADAHLSYFDTHGMSPDSDPDDSQEPTRSEFRQVANYVKEGRSLSLYETIWQTLSPDGLPYPSSARFVREIWGSRLSMMLCEIEKDAQDKIAAWSTSHGFDLCLHRGRWQDFEQLIDNHDIWLVQLDPYEVHTVQGRRRVNDGVMYPEDFDRLGNLLCGLTTPLVVQISSYRTTGADAETQFRWLRGRMKEMGLELRSGAFIDTCTFSAIFSARLDQTEFMSSGASKFVRWAKQRKVGNARTII